MSNEYKPTRKMDLPGGGYESGGSPYEPQPTYPAGGAGYPSYGPGSPGVGYSGAAKTERLQVEPPSFAWLVIVEGLRAGHLFRLHPESTLIGRDPSCDIVLDDSAVSRQHAKVRAVEEGGKKKFVLHDLASENGTIVNGEAIAKHELSDGDQIVIGRTKMVFKQVQL